MRRWMIAAAAAALLAGAWWQRPAAAQRTPEPTAAEEMITFDQYREFRMRDLQQRQARLAHRLAAPGLSAAEKASLERRKAYYDRLAACPPRSSTSSITSASTRSTPITTASSIPKSGRLARETAGILSATSSRARRRRQPTAVNAPALPGMSRPPWRIAGFFGIMG